MEIQRKVYRVLLLIVVAAETSDNFATALEVASQIDLDSREDSSISDGTISMAPFNVDDTFVTNVGFALRKDSSSSPLRKSREFLRAAEGKKRSYYVSHGDSTNQPTVINNIQIVLNKNDSEPTENVCKNGVCDVDVSSRYDRQGNIITNIRLSIVTNLRKKSEPPDVPVIDGIRGVEKIHDPPPPTFQFVNRPPPFRPRYDVPQIETRYRGAAEPWQRNGRTFQRPQSWRRRNGEGRKGFQGQGTWMPSRPVVDDKIEPPLSETKIGDE